MKLKISKIFTSGLFLFILLSFGCKSNKSDDKIIRIGVLQGPSAISFIKMMNEPLTMNGKRVEIIIKSEPQQLQTLMMQNEIEFAVLPTIMAANLYNKGIQYKMIACPIWGSLYIVSNINNYQSLNHLRNKEIYVFGQGTTADILLHKMTSDIPMKINYQFTTNQEVAQALLEKKIHIGIVSEPLVSKLMLSDKNIHKIAPLSLKIDGYTDETSIIQSAFLVNAEYANLHPDETALITKAYQISCNFVSDNPEEAAKLVVKHNILPSKELANISLPLCKIRYISANTIEKELERYLNLFYENNPQSIGGKMPDRDFIFHSNYKQ